MSTMLPNRFRRKFLVEFTVEESDRLDRLGAAHGSRRAAILAGLTLLEGGELDALRQRVATLEGELRAAQAEHDRDAAALATADAAAKQGKSSATALKAEQTAHMQTKAQLKRITGQLGEASRKLATLQATYGQLVADLPAQAYCASCRKLVPRDEWATESTGGADYLYHKRDGFRLSDGGMGGKRATVLFARPASRNATQTQGPR
jgi:hypothetical protein